MRVVFVALTCAFLCFPAASAQSQPVQEVGLCQLRKDAGEFDHKVIRVRGTVNFEFEDFTLHDPQCTDEKATSVWLTYGGDVSDIAVYCCGDHSRAPGDDIRIGGKPVPLLKDSAYEQFNELLRASRNRMPNGEPCYAGCRFYRVTATLTGLFLSEKNSEKGHVGYGHLGCCSLFIIQQVNDVSPERTNVPVGAFGCEKSVWEPTAKDAPELDLYIRCASNCDQQRESAVTHVAAHWTDSIVAASGNYSDAFTDTTGAHPVDHLSWTSDDLLTSYVIVGEETNPPKLSVTREVCHLADPVPTVNQGISCEDYATSAKWSPDQMSEWERLVEKGGNGWEKMLLDSAEQFSSQGDQSWRTKSTFEAAHTILEREIKHWGIHVDPDLKLDKCPKPEGMPGWHHVTAGCTWYSPDGMQEFNVDLMMKKGTPASRWLLNGARGRVCRFDPILSTAGVHVN